MLSCSSEKSETTQLAVIPANDSGHKLQRQLAADCRFYAILGSVPALLLEKLAQGSTNACKAHFAHSDIDELFAE